MFSIPFNITQKTTIHKPVNQVYENLTNFETWKQWSPWLCMEPTAKTKTENPKGALGHMQSWEGSLIGAGQMTLSSLTPNQEVVCDLQFFKPWKSQSVASFKLSPEGDSATTVQWDMQGSLPIFMFFFKKMMSALVDNDFRRGLLMLKEYMESGSVLSKTQITGTEHKNGFFYVGLEHEARISDLGPLMKKDFTAMGECMRNGSIPPPAFMSGIYHKFDMVRGECHFTSCFAYHSEQEAHLALKGFQPTLPSMKMAYVDAHNGFQVEHTGAYEHLGNAWTTAMSAQRVKKLKMDKKVDMYEVYMNTPMNAQIKDLKTQIVIPVR